MLNLLDLNSLEQLHGSMWFNLILLAPLFIVAGVQDFKHRAIMEIVAIAISLALFLHALFLNNSWFAMLIVVVCIFFTLGPVELELFGQADFLMVAHFITAYTWTFTGIHFTMLAGIIWLGCLALHLVFYRDESGKRWRPFAGVMVPALPSYAASVVIMSVLRVALNDVLFFSGF